MCVGKECLIEIMSQLFSNFILDVIDDFIFSFWEFYDFFGYKKYQNLWSKNNQCFNGINYCQLFVFVGVLGVVFVDLDDVDVVLFLFVVFDVVVVV